MSIFRISVTSSWHNVKIHVFKASKENLMFIGPCLIAIVDE